jgi:CrcB protein
MNRVSPVIFPIGTLAVNLIGSLIIGILFELFDEYIVPIEVRYLLTVGFLGGFTTFSTYALESGHMLRNGEYRFFIVNLVLHNLLGVVFVLAGIFLVKLLMKAIGR